MDKLGDYNRSNKLLVHKMQRMLIPLILYEAAMELGNICDDYFAGSFLGSDAIAAVQMGMNIDALIEIPGIVLGSGGCAMVGILLGCNKKQKAGSTFSLTLFLGICFGILFVILSPFSGLISAWMTGSSRITPAVTSFVRFTLLGSPIFCIGLPLSNYAMLDSNAKVGSAYIIVSNFIKLASEYLLLRYTDGGAGMVALSTYIGYGLGLFTFVFYFRSQKRMLKITNPFQGFSDTFHELNTNCRPNIIDQMTALACSVIISIFLIRISDSSSVILLAISDNISFLMFFAFGGVLKLISSMTGVLYGEKDYYGLKSQMKFVIRLSFLIVTVMTAVLCIFTPQYLSLFGFDSSQLEPIHYAAVWISALKMFPSLLLTIMFDYYHAINQNKLASLITLLTGLVLNLPCEILFILLAKHLGINVFYGLLASECLTTVITLIIVTVYIKRVPGAKDFWLLDEKGNAPLCDLTIDCVHADQENITDKMLTVCRENDLDPQLVNFIAVTTEEMLVCIRETNPGHDLMADLSIRIFENNVVMTMRFDGKIFDPSAYTPKAEDASNLAVINKLASKVQYLRVLDFNYTIFTFSRRSAKTKRSSCK